MKSAVRNREVQQVDAFLRDKKRLKPGLPEWDAPSRPNNRQAIWGIYDSLDVERGQLRFRVRVDQRNFPSVSVVFRENPIWRVDLVAKEECKFNPPWAADIGAHPRVCGPHAHTWTDNRQYILNGGPWELKCRALIPGNLKRLDQVLPWLCHEISLDLCDGWRDFQVPAQSELFAR